MQRLWGLSAALRSFISETTNKKELTQSQGVNILSITISFAFGALLQEKKDNINKNNIRFFFIIFNLVEQKSDVKLLSYF